MSQNKSTLLPVVRWAGLILPFLLWLSLHRWGAIPPFVDSVWYSSGIIYHFHYIAQGIFPLWDPFQVWGWPDAAHLRSFGEFNPFYLIIPLLTTLKVPSGVAFNIFLVIFYWLGAIGFYLLVFRLWKRESLALIVYVMLLFSLLGELLFSQLAVPLLLFSTIWFFYFFVGFVQSINNLEQRRAFFGVVFSFMIIMVTYIPSFFLIVLAAVVLATLMLRPALIASFLAKYGRFVRGYPVFAGLGTLCLLLALIPGLSCYLSDKSGDILFLTPRNGFNASNGSAHISLDLINHSGLMNQTSVGELFADQDFVFCCFTYLPIFLLIILGLGMLARMDIRRWIIVIAGFLVLLCSLANVTPVHYFLYKHFSFFHFFRNLYFFGPFLLCFLIVIAMGQLKFFLERRSGGQRERYGSILFVVLVHAIIGMILVKQEHVIVTSYLTLGLSAIVFVAHISGFFEYRRNVFLGCVLFLAILQPYEVISTYWRVWGGIGQMSSSQDKETPFNYLRPLRGQEPDTEVGYLVTAKKRKDESGFFSQGYYGLRYSHMLYSHVLAKDLEQYVRYKLVAYRQVRYMDGDNPDWNALTESIGQLSNPGWVHDKGAVQTQFIGDGKDAQPEFFTKPSSSLEVKEFTPNVVKIATNFTARKFLVYNDSFHKDWHVYINGQIASLYRSNVAFKGVWVDAGHQEIEFRFGSAIQHVFSWVLMVLFICCGLMAIV